MEYLKSVNDITTVEIAERVIKETAECKGKKCEDCYLFEVHATTSCFSIIDNAKRFLREHKAAQPTATGSKPKAKRKPPKPKGPERLGALEDDPTKVITTAEIAERVIKERDECVGKDCNQCYLQGCGDCNAAKYSAQMFLHFANQPAADPFADPSAPAVAEPPARPVHTCSTCSHLRYIGGIPFCYAWHNWTVEDGFCYLYSGRIEDDGEPFEKS